ncbi:MAG: AAA family ATPase [Candidatus Altiarchaeota archaeon]|nr:AAA family ATPase [Candidatus Altiarchaeota archaeon]
MIILLGGPTGAGKSEIGRAVAEKYNATHIQMDSFYNTAREMEVAGLVNWDHPDAFNWERFRDFLTELNGEGPAFVPNYVKEPGYIKDWLEIEPQKNLVIDGLYALSDFEEKTGGVTIENGTIFSIYVDAPAQLRKQRKIKRDTQPEVGRDAETVEKYFDGSLEMEKYVTMTKENADLVVENEGDLQTALDSVYGLIDPLPNQTYKGRRLFCNQSSV